jgi:hypothetical protein
MKLNTLEILQCLALLATTLAGLATVPRSAVASSDGDPISKVSTIGGGGVLTRAISAWAAVRISGEANSI